MNKFSTSILIALAVSGVSALEPQIQDPELLIANQGEDFEKEMQDKTMVGFLFSGKDLGKLWQGLTTDQKDEIKDEVFAKILQDHGYNPNNYTDDEFVFTEAEL